MGRCSVKGGQGTKKSVADQSGQRARRGLWRRCNSELHEKSDSGGMAIVSLSCMRPRGVVFEIGKNYG